METPGEVRDALRAVEQAVEPLDAVLASRSLRTVLDGWERRLVAEAQAGGQSWEAVGRALGLSRQAAWERYRKSEPAPSRRLEAGRQRQRTLLGEARELRAAARSATGDARAALLQRADELRARALAALDDDTEHTDETGTR